VPTYGATAWQIDASIDVAMVGDYEFCDRSVDVTFVVGHELLEANPAGPTLKNIIVIRTAGIQNAH
jgi:hypothetical protein